MKRARIIVLAIAVFAAGLAAILAKSFIGTPRTIIKETTSYQTEQVLVAKSNIGLGDSLKGSDLRWQPWPADAPLAGYITRKERANAVADLTGAIVRAPFLAGEPIKDQKLIKASEGGVMAAILPTGMRAISTPIREETAAGGFILPNDRVDVILTRRLRGNGRSGEEHVSDTLFQNVRILAIGQDIEMKDGKKVAAGKTATLELDPKQSETLALAQSMGDISLTLRSLQDSREGENPTAGAGLAKKSQGSGIRILRYGNWTRAYGIN